MFIRYLWDTWLGEELELGLVSSAWEADGSIWSSIQKNKYSPFGYYFQVFFRITQTVDKEDTVLSIRDFLNSKGFNSRIARTKRTGNRQDVIEVRVAGKQNCYDLITHLRKYIIGHARRKQLETTSHILERLIRKDHLFPDGFLEIIDLIQEERKWKTRQSHPKYTREFFEELWEKQGGVQVRQRKHGRIHQDSWPEILRMKREGVTLREIGEKFGVVPQSIYYLLIVKKIGERVKETQALA